MSHEREREGGRKRERGQREGGRKRERELERYLDEERERERLGETCRFITRAS